MTIRGDILSKAKELTEGDRNATYGDPADNLRCFARLVEAYLDGTGYPRTELNSVHSAIIMVLAKVSRVAANLNHADNYVDMAAYAAIAGECAQREAE